MRHIKIKTVDDIRSGIIEKWLEEAGFEVVGIFDDMTTEKAHPETERAVFLAKKK